MPEPTLRSELWWSLMNALGKASGEGQDWIIKRWHRAVGLSRRLEQGKEVGITDEQRADLERRMEHLQAVNPMVHAALMLWKLGELQREEALQVAILALADENASLQEGLVAALGLGSPSGLITTVKKEG